MRFKLCHPVWLMVASTVSAIGLSSSHKGLLQISPSFSGDGVTLYPGLHPSHDLDDLNHLIPDFSRDLYYTQEGHRPALHGAKHAQMTATFNHPTVVMEHSNYIKSVECYKEDEAIVVCLKTPQAFDTVQSSWEKVDSPAGEFNLVTFHTGCGDETSGKRSFFRASDPIFNPETQCVTVPAIPIQEDKALDSGDISWGTYVSPDNRKREPVKGHVRVVHDYPMSSNESHSEATMDLVDDPWALWTFFNDTNIDTQNMDEPADNSLNFTEIYDLVERSNNHLSKRGLSELWNGIVNGIKKLIRKVVGFFKTAAQLVAEVTKFIWTVAIVSAKLIMAAFGVPFDHSYHNDFVLHYRLKSDKADKPPGIFGYDTGLKLQGISGSSSIQCAKCGIDLDFVVDGRLAFSIKQGITKGEVSLENRSPMKFDAVFGITMKDFEVSKQKKIPKLKKQLAGVPLSPLAIPGIINLGPQVSISVAVELEIEGDIELLVGGSYSLSPGRAVLNLIDKKKNGITGLKGGFTPVFKAQGEVELTAALGLPIALEVGLDVLNGKFKETVGLVDTPAVYASATYSKGEGHKCDGGIELRVGIKNEITVEAFDLWEEKLREDTLYEKGITCITSKGFDKDAVEDDESVFATVEKKIPDVNATLKAPKIDNVANNLTTAAYKNQGFRVVMDGEESSILVSGKDGFLYLVEKKEEYDLSSPWGTLNMTANVLTFDVFGRILSYDQRRLSKAYSVAELSVNNATQMPKSHRATSLTVMKNDKEGLEVYGMPVIWTFPNLGFKRDSKPKKEETKELFYPTACKTTKGLRLFATRWLLNKNGKVQELDGSVNSAQTKQIHNVFKERYKVKNPATDCRTIRLTSSIKGLQG